MRFRACLALTAALLLAAHAAAQRDPATALREQAAWQALDAGDAHRAADLFRQAIAADPKNARLYLGAGTAAYLERRDDDAREALERAIALDGALLQARALLGQVLHRNNGLNDAIRVYEDLASRAPGDRGVQATLERWRREAELHDRMQQAVGERFTVSFEGPPEADAARLALEALDRAFFRIGETLGLYPAQAISVVLYTSEQFSDITRSPAWAAGAYDGIIRVPMRGALNEAHELDRVFAHEFTHALVHDVARRALPTWFNEGLATALESDDLQWARDAAAHAAVPVPLSALQRGWGGLNGQSARVAYATSALAVTRLLRDAGGPAIANVLRDVGDGVDFEASFARRMQQTLAQFDAARPPGE